MKQCQDLEFDVTRRQTCAPRLTPFYHPLDINHKMMQRAVLLRSLRLATSRAASNRTLGTLTRAGNRHPQYTRSASHVSPNLVRWLSSKSAADEKIEEITELYATAQDEFEIAMEETEKMSVYAEEDRKAAREELTRVQEAYKLSLIHI